MKKLFSVSLALCLLLGCAASAEAATVQSVETETTAPSNFLWYIHDPRDNPSAMADIVADPAAIYGFRPSPAGSLALYADADWTDPDVVEAGRQDRLAYHESIEDMYVMFNDMKAEGKTTEEIARAVSAERNEIRLAAYADDPEGLKAIKARNLEKYGHEEGPLADELYAKYGSWQRVLESAFSTNSGMDACLGMYDDYFDLYVASGQVEADKGPSEETLARFDALVAANSWEATTERHSAKMTCDAYLHEGKTLLTFTRRVDGQSDYFAFSDGLTLLTRPDLRLEQYPDGKVVEYLKLPEDYLEDIADAQSEIAMRLMPGETPISLYEQDGRIQTVTETLDPENVEQMIDSVNAWLPEEEQIECQEGMRLRFYTIFDPDTLDIQEGFCVLVDADGNTDILQTEGYAYDTEDNSETGPFADYFAIDECRTITVNFAADTDAVETLIYLVPVGYAFDITYRNAPPVVYTDAELTTELDYKSVKDLGDTTLYVKLNGD